jgi:hypothetical protein
MAKINYRLIGKGIHFEKETMIMRREAQVGKIFLTT